mmetsp:Transcript_38757/g.84400  ORF Transcript_38757/g.84400 Transcript_38757/m.84400 type:complete len:213 (-) Transcript_38757:83-721(-)
MRSTFWCSLHIICFSKTRSLLTMSIFRCWLASQFSTLFAFTSSFMVCCSLSRVIREALKSCCRVSFAKRSAASRSAAVCICCVCSSTKCLVCSSWPVRGSVRFIVSSFVSKKRSSRSPQGARSMRAWLFPVAAAAATAGEAPCCKPLRSWKSSRKEAPRSSSMISSICSSRSLMPRPLPWRACLSFAKLFFFAAYAQPSTKSSSKSGRRPFL